MNLGTYDINIDFSKLFIHNNTSIYFKEGDLNTAKIRARLTMKNKPINIAGCNVTIRIEPSSGNTITDNATVIDPLNGIIEIDLKSNALLEGTHLFEVWIIKDESVKKSGKIGYRVLDSIDDAGAIEGTNEYPILISLISDTNKAIQDAKEVLNIAKDMEANVNEAIGNTNIAISNAETATSNANSKITELDDAKTSMITKVDASIDTMKSDVNKAKEDMKLTTDAKVKEIDTAITNMNSSVEDAKSDMQATTDAKMQQVDNSIVTMKSEVETAKNEMASKTDAKMQQVDRALAAGTVDLELKQAREDASGVVYDNLKQMLDANLGVEGKTLKDLVIDMNNMKEMQDLEYSTDKGYAVCEKTGNGTVKDLKIYGKSFVNIGGSNFSWGRNYANLVIKKDLIKSNTKYGFKLEGDLSNLASVYCGSSDDSEIFIPRTYNKTQLIFNSPNISFTKEIKFICYNNGTEFTESQVKTWKLTIVECENEEKIPSYFEGLASVGNGSGIEVLSRKEDGNLFDITQYLHYSQYPISTDNGYRQKPLFVGKNTTVKINVSLKKNMKNCNAYFLVNNLKGIITGWEFILHTAYDFPLIFEKVVTSDSDGFIYLNFTSSPTSVQPKAIFDEYVDSICISKQSLPSNTPYVEDIKIPLYKDTDGLWKPILNVRGIDENNCDLIENGKFINKYYHINLKGDSEFNIARVNSYDTQDTVCFAITIKNNYKKSNDQNIPINQICDKFKQSVWAYTYLSKINEESISYTVDNSNSIYIKILKTKLNSLDVNGFKQYLQNNNVNIVYELETYFNYEINPIYPEAFEDETLMLFKTGPISPRATWKITSNLVGVLGNVKDRVKRMENDFYKYTVTQNRMQLGTTYSSDRTTFRVDTATFSTEKAKQDLDYDLFRLLKHNILVGPHNYDKAEMENMMDFYVSVGKIDYNMWDELYMLIEEQHNPPVEEEAPVI